MQFLVRMILFLPPSFLGGVFFSFQGIGRAFSVPGQWAGGVSHGLSPLSIGVGVVMGNVSLHHCTYGTYVRFGMFLRRS